MEATIFNIQKFSLHDGPGIRSVVFFKGCPLRCRWCSNPESQERLPQLMRDKTKCTACGLCKEGLRDPDRCPAGALSLEGFTATPREVFEKVMQDRDFYLGSGGGVTFSGGEPLLHTEFIARLSALLRKEKIHLAAETTGFSGPAEFAQLAESVDLLLFDLKHWNEAAHIKGTGVSNTPILENLDRAAKGKAELWARIPVIPGYNDSLYDMEQFGTLLQCLGVGRVCLLPFHRLGENKYALLGRKNPMQGAPALQSEELKPHLACIMNYVPQAQIGG